MNNVLARRISDGTARSLSWLALLIPTLAFANAALYIAYATNPLVTSDAWYFVDSFLAPVYEHGLELSDLYVKRSTDDHAQPLQKLLLLANARWFHLDFVFESLVGLAFAMCIFILLVRALAVGRKSSPASLSTLIACTAAIAASLVSLNSGMVFNWSLVTLGYLPQALLVSASLVCWRFLAGRGKWPFVLLFSFIAFTQDTMAILSGASIVAAAGLAALLKQTDWRRSALATSVVIIALCAYAVASRGYLHVGLVSPAPTDTFSKLLHLAPEYPGMLGTVLGSSIAHINPLTAWFGESARFVQLAVATIVLATHVWFWRRVFSTYWNAAIFTAVCIMLMMYASTLAIVLGRVPLFGADYLHEPRYVLTWQMSIVALALMAGASERKPTAGHSLNALVNALLVLVVLLQIPLSLFTWKEGRYIQPYVHNMARQMYLMALNPSARLTSCVPMLSVCNSSQTVRARSINFLKENHLNAYSDDVVRRYSLEATRHPPGPPQATNSTSK